MMLPAAKSRSILITGGTGFVGASLVRRMIMRGHEVHVIARSSNVGRIAEVADHVRVHCADLTDADATREAVTAARPEVVLHFAAHPALPQEVDEAEVLLHTVKPLVNLVSACRGCELFINAGSSSEYGYQTKPMSETSLPNPTRVHDIAKLAQTLYGTYAARFKGVPLVTLRLFSVYGPWEQGRRLIPRLMMSALNGRLVNLSSPDVGRDFVFVDDVVDAIEHCMGRRFLDDQTVFNLGTGVEHTIRDVANIIEDIHGRRLPLNWGSVGRQRWDFATLGRRYDPTNPRPELHRRDRSSRWTSSNLPMVCRERSSL